MKHEKYARMYRQYLEGFSLEQVGRMEGMTRQSVYAGFRVRNYELRKKRRLPYQTFNGVKFTPRNHGYLARTDGDRKLMHRYVWEYYNGAIPAGYDIHHVNHDRQDNRIENLELYTKSEHARMFATGNNQHGKKTN